MNIQELDAYNLADAVKFNDHLNPNLWDKNEQLRDDVRAQLLLIAEDFRESLGIKDLDLKDITISGSNAAYTYTPNSDIDLHLVVNQPEDPVYRELFDAKKAQYNDTHNITVKGADVELYVEAADKPPVSLGTYSLLQDRWIQVPRRVKASVDDTATRNKFETVGHAIERAVKSGDRKLMDRVARKIKRMRQTGLEAHGEFGPENLAFKILRSQGVLQQLHDARLAAKNQELSLKERKKPGSVFTYGFKHEEQEMEEDAGISPDGVNPTTCMFLNEQDPEPTDEEILGDFIDFCVKELKLSALPEIKLRRDPQWSVVHKTFGRYIDAKNLLEVAWGQRHIMDVLRTVAHELTHRRQHEREAVPASAGETGSEYENEANARAGILMRDYARLHPEFFEAGQAEELHGDEVHESASGYIPTKKQAKDPRYVMALTKDVRPGAVGKEANKLNLKTNKQGQPQIANPNGLFEELRLQLEAFKKADEDYSPDAPPGPESKPTMPKGTIRVDVSDMYDWYKLGKDISNLKGADKSQFGKGPPSTIVSFGDEDTEHKYIKDLENLGLTTTDIDPVDPNQPKNMPRQKTDPTYNVNENVPQPGQSSGAAKQFNPGAKIQTRQMTLDQILNSVKGIPYVNNVVDDWDAKDYSWGVTKKVIEYAQYLQKNPQSVANLPPLVVIDGKLDDGAHRLSAINLLQKRMDPKNPLWKQVKLKVNFGTSTDVASTQGVSADLTEAEELDEVKMSPKALKQFADSPAAKGILVGFEAEMIVPDVNTGDDSGEMEPDYDADERCRSIQQVIEFFEYDEYGYGLSGRDAEKLQERLDEAYFEWHDDQMMRDFQEEAEDLIKKVIVDEGDWVQEDEVRKQLDMMEITGKDQEAVLAAGSQAPRFNSTKEQQAYAEEHPEYEKYVEALGEAEGLLDELVQDSVREQDKYWDAAIDDFRDNYYVSDDSGFFDDVGLRYMSDVANRFDVYWPYMTFEEGGGSQDIDSVADSLSEALGMKVVASYSYHGTARKPDQFIVEPDSSLSADSYEDGGLEIISPPMPIEQAMEKLNQVIAWAQAKGCYTNSSTGLHMGVSLPGQKSFAEAEGDVEPAPVAEKPIDFMKLALFLGDQHVLEEFGRSANHYCASSLKKMKEKRWSPQQIATAMEKMRSNLINLAYKDLADRSPGRDSINMKDNYVEFRGAGGDYLSRESDEGMDFLENTLLRYVQALAIAGDPNAYRDEYAKKLYKLISPTGDDTLDLFSQFATGEISSEQLKKDWAKRTLEKDTPVAKGNWVVVDNNTGKTVTGQEYSGYTEDEVYEKAKAKLGEYMTKTAFNMAYSIHPKETGRWEVYRDDHGQDETLEIIDADRKGEAVNKAADKYTGVIPFKVRAYYGDEEAKPEPTRRAKLAKNIIQQPAEEVKNWIVYDTVTGEEQYNQPGRKSNLVQAMRKMEQDNKWPQGRLALKLSDNQDIPPQASTSQQATTTEGVPVWEVYEIETGHVVYKFDADTKQKADEQRQLWLAHVGAEQPDLFGVRPKMAQPSVQDVKPDVAQNFTAQQGEQEVDGTGEPIWEIYEVGSGRVVEAFVADDQRDATEHLQSRLEDWGTLIQDEPELYAVRPKMVEQSTPPDATEQTGTWQLVDVTLNQPVETFQGTWAEAERIAQQYETGPGERNGHEISVRRA